MLVDRAPVTSGSALALLLQSASPVAAVQPPTTLASVSVDARAPTVIGRDGRHSVHEDPNPLLDLTFVRAPENARERTPIGARWRHSFDIVLTASADARIVHDEAGERFVFERVATTEEGEDATAVTAYRPDVPHAGQLERRDGVYHWSRADGTDVRFVGSLPIAMRDASGTHAVTLDYADGRLASVTDRHGRAIGFAHDGDALRRILLPDGSRLWLEPAADGSLHLQRRARASDADSRRGECRPSDTAADGTPEPTCDTASAPPDAGFLLGAGIPGASRVDARPASCRSYFVDYAGTDRGERIEIGLDGLTHYAGYAPTVRSFPIVDFVGAELRVVRSRDLASPSYDTVPNALFERLLRDGDDIARQLLEPLARDGRLSVTELGRTTTLEHRPARPVVLELVVRHGLASADQMRQIARARQALSARHAIALRVVEIP